MQTVAHAIVQRLKCLIPRAMTRIESNPRVTFYQPGGQSPQLLPCLLVVQQMEATHNRLYRVRTGCQDVFQATVGTAREEQPTRVERQLMTEVVGHVLPLPILHTEMTVPLWHRVNLRDTGHDKQVVGYHPTLLHRQ